MLQVDCILVTQTWTVQELPITLKASALKQPNKCLLVEVPTPFDAAGDSGAIGRIEHAGNGSNKVCMDLKGSLSCACNSMLRTQLFGDLPIQESTLAC